MTSLSDYLVLQRIGGGTFGDCSKVCLRADRSKVLAWKEIDYRQFSEAELAMLCQEVNLLRALKHPNVVAYHSRIVDAGTGRVFVLMEFCQHGDLSSLIGALASVNRLQPDRFAPEPFVRRVCYQLVDALHYCHASQQQQQRPVIHRDLKPANVLLDANWNAKLADFGLSRVLSSVQSLATTFVGSPMFMSPELLGEEGFTTPKSDVWALGCVLHQLMALKAPFSAQSETLLRLQIRNGRHSQLPVAAFSAALRRLATEMLQVDLALRPSSGELLARSEVRAWADAAAKPWSPFEAAACDCEVQVCAATDETSAAAASASAGGGEGRHQGQSGAGRLELLQLQARLADTEDRLLAREAELQERQQRQEAATAEADERAKRSAERLGSWEARLMRLHESLCEKQRLMAAAAAAAARADGGRTSADTAAADAGSTRNGHSPARQKRRHTASEQELHHQQHRSSSSSSSRRTAVLQSINLSPIVTAAAAAAPNYQHQQQLQPVRQFNQLQRQSPRDAVRGTALGKYSPVQQLEPQKQQQQGTYQPILQPQQQQQQRILTPRAIANNRGD